MSDPLPDRVDVLVIGGGLTGLAAALRAARVDTDGGSIAERTVLVCEESDRFGGQISTERSDGYVVELGAEGFVSRSEAMVELARETWIESRLVDQLTLLSFGYDGGPLVELGPGEAAIFLGFQVPKEDFGKGVRSFWGGTGDIVEALVEKLSRTPGVRLVTRRRAVRITVEGDGAHVDFGNGTSIRARTCILTTSARVAADLLPDFGAKLSPLREASVLSSVTVSLAYRPEAFASPPSGSGVVVAEAHRRYGFRACAFTSEKLPHRAPRDAHLLRVFFRPEASERETVSEEVWAKRAAECVATIIPVKEPPERAWVSQWWDTLPVFSPAYRAAVSELEAALPRSIVLAGSAFHGAGIDAAVQSAFRAAERARAGAVSNPG